MDRLGALLLNICESTMKAIFFIIIFFSLNLPTVSLTSETKVRPEVIDYIDELRNYKIESIGHTTDSIPPPKTIRLPSKPQNFEAGRYEVLFLKKEAGSNYEPRKIIIQTECLVGHLSKIIPGEMDIGGYIKIFCGRDQFKCINGTDLNSKEIEAFILMLYDYFQVPINDHEENLINKVKDFALAIYFSDRKGIEDFHEKQTQRISVTNQYR